MRNPSHFEIAFAFLLPQNTYFLLVNKNIINVFWEFENVHIAYCDLLGVDLNIFKYSS